MLISFCRVAISSFAMALLLGCAAPAAPFGKLGKTEEAVIHAKVQEAAAQGRWLESYTLLEKALSSPDPQEVSNAVAIAARYPEMLRAADGIFEVEPLHAFMVQRGKNVGRDLSNIRLQTYWHVATKEGYARAQANIQQAFDRFALDEAAKREGDMRKLIEASEKARFTCRDTTECSKAFSLTQIFVSENADMKVQTANDTIIETFNPTENMKVGIKAVKFPRSGTTAEITLSTSCPAKTSGQDLQDRMVQLCVAKQTRIYEAFTPFLRRNLQN